MKRKAMLWVVDPGIKQFEAQAIEEFQQLWHGEIRVFRPVLETNGHPVGYQTALIVILGSAASANDQDPWVNELRRWLKPLLDGTKPIPLLGICFGHQLIAQTTGATVGFLYEDQHKLKDIQTTRFEKCRLFPEPVELCVVCSHREEVKEVPDGYRRIAQRPGVAIDALEHESLPITTVQFHPEARDEFALNVGIDPHRIDQQVISDCRRLLRAFLSQIPAP